MRPNPLKLRYTEEHEAALITAELQAAGLRARLIRFFCSLVTSKVKLFEELQVSESGGALS